MQTPTCSKCRRTIPSEDINVANDVAYCRACNLSYSLAELTHDTEMDSNVDLQSPPKGAWNRNAEMGGVAIGATHRSIGTAIGALAISLFWNGIVSIFVLLATASTLQHLHIPVPDWFPAPRMNGSPMNLGITIFLWIFLSPFIGIGLFMISTFLLSLAGHTEVRIRNGDGLVFTGIGPIGYRRHFDARAVKQVRISDQVSQTRNGGNVNKSFIMIETREGKRIKFGSMLREDRRKFMTAAVRRALVH
jgi:hypothetical protein